jgi:hypothetical protein
MRYFPTPGNDIAQNRTVGPRSMKLGTIASPFLYNALARRALRPSIPIAARCPPTLPFAGPCFRATGIGPSCSQKSPVAASCFRQDRGKDPARTEKPHARAEVGVRGLRLGAARSYPPASACGQCRFQNLAGETGLLGAPGAQDRGILSAFRFAGKTPAANGALVRVLPDAETRCRSRSGG